MIKVIHDILTNTYTEVPLTNDEIKAREAAKTQHLADQAAKDADQAAKDAAKQAVLDKLGLSADEVAALLS